MPRNRAYPLLVLLAALLARAPRAAAQEVADTFFLGELVVTATRVPIPRAAVPAAVSVLEGAELRARGVRFVADALREVAGASLVRNGSRGGLTSLFLRGGESDYVQVLVDGVVLNDPGGAIDLGQLTTDEVERIEVVRGPVSVLYGSDAVTGVVHVFTRSGVGPARMRAAVEMGTSSRRSDDVALCGAACPAEVDLDAFTTRRVAADVAGSAGALGWALGASDLRSDGAYPFNNAYHNRSFSGRAQLGGGGGDAALTARYTDGLYRYPTDGAGRLVDANVFRSSESLVLGLDVGRWWGESVETRLALSRHDGDFATVDRPDGAADTLGFFASRSGSRVDRRKADLHVNVRAPGSSLATLGVELERQEGTSEFSSDSEFGPFESSTEDERSNRAFYAQLTASPRSWLSLTGGGRTERNDRFGSFFTWRAGANLRAGPATLLRASAGNAFKEPTFFENYAEGFTVGNPELEPERSRSWEVGVEQRLAGDRARVGATWFDQRFDNLIMYTGSPAPGQPNYVNVGEAVARGLEVEGRARLGAGTVTASWVRLDTEVTDEGEGTDRLFALGEALIRRPRDRFNATAWVPLGDRVRAGGSVLHVGSRDDLDFTTDFSGVRVRLPAHTVMDLFAEGRLWSDAGGARELSVQLRVENLLGEEFQEVFNFPGPRRALYVGVSAGAGF
jgi:vitamin B12 transporter